MKEQIFSRRFKLILSIFVISIPVYYGFLYWTGIIEEYRKIEPKSRSAVKALSLSLGAERFYKLGIDPEDKTFYDRFHKKTLDNQELKNLFNVDYNINYSVFLFYNEQFMIPFFPHWKKQTDTIGVVVRSVESLHHPEILKQLIEVAERPCDHLPSRKEIDLELINKGKSIVRMDSDRNDTLPPIAILDERYQKARKEKKAKAPTDHEALVYSFKRAREVLQCDILPKPNREKVRIDFLDFQKDENGQLARTDRKISLEVQRLD